MEEIKRPIRRWAFWRRFQYGFGFTAFWCLVGVLVYFTNIYQPPNCFDGIQNGEETYTDAGGPCVRIDPNIVLLPKIVWTESFKVADGQYNAVAYVENENQTAATPELNYTFQLLNKGIVVAERRGTTVLPPNSSYPIFEGRIFTDNRQEVTETKLTLEPSDVWIPASIGRDQFRSIDIELLGADVRPRLNVEIENTELVAAENVEVIATIFNTAGIPVASSQTFIEDIAPRSTEDIIFTWPNPLTRTVRSCVIPTDVVLGIDLSGSMNNDGDNPPQPVTDALAAAGTFVNSLQEEDQIGVVTFATRAAVATQLNNIHGAVANSIITLEIEPAEEVGFTNTPAALAEAMGELNSERHNENARRVLVLLTDGLPTAAGDADVISEAVAEAQKLNESGIEVFAIGLGENVDADFVRSIASDQTNAYFAPSGADLASIYAEITTSLCEAGEGKIEVIAKTKTNFAPLR